MTAKIRAKLASSLNNIEKPEDWQWKRWLKPPSSASKPFFFPKVLILNKKSFSTYLDIPSVDGFICDILFVDVSGSDVFFKLLKISPSKSYKAIIPQQKTVRLFINMVPAKTLKKVFTNKLTADKVTIQLIEKNIQIPIIKIVKYHESSTVVKDKFPEKIKNAKKNIVVSKNIFTEKFQLNDSPDCVFINWESLTFSGAVSESLLTHESNVIIKEIRFDLDVHLFNYEFKFKDVNNTDNLLPGKSNTIFLDDKHLTKYYFVTDDNKNVSLNLISYEYLTKFIDPTYLQRFFIDEAIATDNLLPTGTSIELIDNLNLLKYYMNDPGVSDELLSIFPATYNVALLNTNNFEVQILDLKNTSLEYIPEQFQIQNRFSIKQDDIKKARTSEIHLEKFSVTKKQVTTVQVQTLTNQEVSVNYCHRKLLYKIPQITELSDLNTVVTNDKHIDITPSVNFDSSNIFQYDTNEFSSLYPKNDIDLNTILKSFLPLHEFQRQGVEFLLTNPFAILVDEPGLGKTIQSISALRVLFKIGLIRSVLIICPDLEFGSSELSQITGKSEGWEGHFYNWAPELSVKVIRGDDGQRKIDWYDFAQVFIVSFSSLSNDIRKRIIDYDRLKIFNSLIIDDIRHVQTDFIENKKVFDSLKLNYMWILNDYPFEYHLDEMICYIKPRVEEHRKMDLSGFFDNQNKPTSSYLRRQKNEVINFLPQKSYIDKWVELHPEQITEYDFILNTGLQKIAASLETGNILIIQPQVFNLLHQLMQICNYPSKSNQSGKEYLLMNQLDTIIQNREKVIILSQYEKQGIKKIEDLLSRNKVGYVTYQSGISESNLIKNIKDFNSKDNINAFVMDSKALRGVLNVGAVTNIIHFDHWWNPSSMWQIEDKIVTGNGKKYLNVYTYWTLNTIEESIYKILSNKGLFLKGIVESLSSIFVSEAISTDDWLNIIGIPSSISDSTDDPVNSAFEKLNNMPMEVFKEIGKNFLTKLGYGSSKFMTYVDSSGKDLELTSKVINNKEETIIVKFVNSNLVDADLVYEFINTVNNYRNISRSYLITSGLFTREARQFTTYKGYKLNLIDGKILSNYLLRFNLI